MEDDGPRVDISDDDEDDRTRMMGAGDTLRSENLEVRFPSRTRELTEEQREKSDFRSYARASLPNVTFSYLQKAAKLIKEYMTSG